MECNPGTGYERCNAAPNDINRASLVVSQCLIASILRRNCDETEENEKKESLHGKLRQMQSHTCSERLSAKLHLVHVPVTGR
jgi:hypothetical protein